MSSGGERFTSRWGLIVSVLGIAVGTGNIWRFPRIAAANGGGSFLIPWVIFLFLWSIPLIMAEFAIGKSTRHGTVGAFARLMGERFTWMGLFVGFVASAIMFYYSVVTGWCFRYLLLAATGQLFQIADYTGDWNHFTLSGWQPIIFHFLAISFGVWIISRGVVAGIERTNRLLIPTLLILIVVSAIRAVTLPGALEGLNYLFTPRLDGLLDYRVWLHALTQNAWDTGAGWGLILTYAVYMREREDVPLNAALIGLGNNSVSLLAGITVFCTVFALMPSRAMEIATSPGPANTGLTFIWIPQLFEQMVGGAFFCLLFFLALSFAALSSLISLLELAVRILMDLKISRQTALMVVYLVGFTAGLPSALSQDFFVNQDWTWGIALMISGLFVALAVLVRGVEDFRNRDINSPGSDLHIGRWYDWIIRVAIPVQVIVLVLWWFWQAMIAGPDDWWNPFRIESVGTCLFQWGIVLIVFLMINRRVATRTLKK